MYTIIDLVSCWKGLLFKHEVNTTLEACNDTHVQCMDNCSLISPLYFFILLFSFLGNIHFVYIGH